MALCWLVALSLSAGEPKRIDLVVLDADSGKPVEKATVRIFNGIRPTPYAFTDAAGRATVDYPPGGDLTLDVHTTQHIQQRVTLSEMKPRPSNVTLKLRRGTRTAGGVVVDEDGNPVSGATVRFSAYLGAPQKSPGMTELVCDIDAATNAEGRWTLKVLDQSPTHLHAHARHEDFAFDQRDLSPPSSHEFLNGKTTLVLKRGVLLHGTVRDERKQPIPGAPVVAVDERGLVDDLSPSARSGADGGFRLRLNPGRNTLVAQAAGRSPVRRTVVLGEKAAEIALTMPPGRIVRGRVLNEAGQPIAGVHVGARFEGTRMGLGLRLGVVTDEDGTFVLRDAPAELFNLSAYRDGFTYGQAAVAPQRSEVSFVLKPMGARGPGGGLVNVNSLSDPSRRKERTGAGVVGVVTTPDGRPAADALVLLARQKDELSAWMRDGRIVNEFTSVMWTCDEQGRFNLPYQGQPYALAVSHDSGWALWRPVSDQNRREPPKIALKPWATLTGIFLLDGKPAPNMEIHYAMDRAWDPNDRRTRLYFQATAKTDAEGRFVMTRVPTMAGKLTRHIPLKNNGRTAAFIAAVDPKAGGTQDLGTVRQRGRTVVGLLKLPKHLQPRESDYEVGFTCLPLDAEANSDRPRIPYPAALEGKPRKAHTDWWLQWQSTPEGKAYSQANQRLRVQVEPDGRFRIDGAQADSLLLTIRLRDPASTWNDRRDVLAEATKRFVVPPMPNGYDDAPLALGELDVVSAKATLTGMRVADFAAKGLDGKSWRLSFEKGNVVLLDFWATWCGPCIEAFPDVADLHDELGAKGLVIVGVSVDDEASDAADLVQKEKIAWRQVHVGPKSPIRETLGIESYPTFIVIDRAGKVRYRGGDLHDAGRAARGALAQ